MTRDLRVIKGRQRERIKAQRQSMPDELKARWDEAICRRLVSCRPFAEAHTLLLYSSLPIEVGTWGILEEALRLGKRVAAPRCLPGSRRMEFRVITSAEELVEGSYGIREPHGGCPVLRNFAGSLCVVPALAYDKEGFRLGYGGGYYDRFLSHYEGVTVGIIYRCFVREKLAHGRYDRAVQYLVTEKELRSI